MIAAASAAVAEPTAPPTAVVQPDAEAAATRVRAAGEAAKSAEIAVAAQDEEPADPEASKWPRERAPMPYEIVRSLQFLQDQVARGNGPAIRVQSMLLRRYGPTFLGLKPETWEDPRNRRAAALFVLSGGPPSVLRGILARVTLAPEDRPLLEGALAYVENRSADAEKKLSVVDLTHVESGLAAQVNLAVAQLQQADKPAEALRRLSQVMLIAPGTLLEEAALRMGVLLAEQTGDQEAANRYARQYFDRFSASAYAGNFRARFAAVYAARPAGTEDAVIATIADATATIPRLEQLGIYLAVGRRALVAGNLTLANKAAAKALTYDEAGESERQRALLYEVASTLTERDFAEVKATLEAIDPDALHPADRELRNAAMDVLSEMRKPMVAGIVGAEAPQEAATLSPILARGAAILDAVRDDLKKAAP
ncbi:hypothetical protein [Aurantimonas sp. A3-2-R12]|uniref:hypothetical protein n=1 Tax=Aurantimonas sp. A3-2-R12 TaxID=3114362 RepID=UPI002E1802C4|nr:hypothetical protein [Aurantimonas sp. A3-2-R12]